MSSSADRYLEALNERKRKIESKISEQNSKLQESKIKTRLIEKKIFSLEHQLERVEQEIEDYQNNQNQTYDSDIILKAGDKYHYKKEAKIHKVEDQIQQLTELRNNLFSVHYQKVIDKRIEWKKNKIKRLQKRKVRVENIQRSVILKKRVIKNIKSRMYGKQESRLDYWDNKVVDTEEKLENIETDTGIKKQLLDMVYNMQLKRYKKNQEIYRQLIRDLQDGNVNILGANFIVIGKKIASIFRKQNTRGNSNSQNNNPQNNNQQNNNSINR